MLGHFAEKLPISRWQRDLTDSTVQRNFGVAIGYLVIAMQSALKGLGKLRVDNAAIKTDVAENWEVLAEAVQSVMRRYGISEPYEKLKALTRGQAVTKEQLHEFIGSLDIPKAEKERLIKLTPGNYTGLAAELASRI
jgi:adenylosuccinate lyase